MLCTASSHFVFDLCMRPFYGCARRLLFVHKETPGTRLSLTYAAYKMHFSIHDFGSVYALNSTRLLRAMLIFYADFTTIIIIIIIMIILL